MGVMVSQITSLPIVYSTVYSGADQRKHQSSTSLAFVRGIHRWLVNSPHKRSVTRKMFPFDDVIMIWEDFMTQKWLLQGQNYNKSIDHRSLILDSWINLMEFDKSQIWFCTGQSWLVYRVSPQRGKFGALCAWVIKHLAYFHGAQNVNIWPVGIHGNVFTLLLWRASGWLTGSVGKIWVSKYRQE